ncbi:replicative DNA helicase [Bacillus sp. SG-1]|nr:replicative DNA helicase [Bacillus sp. SG-1]
MLNEFIEPLLPKSFDKNEWYILVISTIMVLIFLLIPKRFPSKLTLNLILFNLVLSFVIDHLLAMPPHDFYDIMDRPSFELFDLIIYIFAYSFFGYFLLYMYDMLKLNYKRTIVFILTFSIIVTGLEAISTYIFEVYKYHEWNLIFSFLSYIILFLLNVLYFRWIVSTPT